jgi:hypothetical protein
MCVGRDELESSETRERHVKGIGHGQTVSEPVGLWQERWQGDPVSREADQPDGDAIEAVTIQQATAEQPPENAVDLNVKVRRHGDSLTSENGACRGTSC